MLDYCIGMIGTPAQPEAGWSESKLKELKGFGFNTMQLNIAWGCRPGDEPLNLEDVLVLPEQTGQERKKAEKRREDIRGRLKLCRENGMRSLFHFGAPFNGLEPYQGLPPKNCFHSNAVLERYRMLLGELDLQIPGIDDILIYTYDQDAWLCSEFSECENCRGIPLHKRLPQFLTALAKKWSSINPLGRLWWESWELSAGQTLSVIEQLPCEGFGLMLHSNVGEVQKTRPVDLWFKNVCMIAEQKGIPVVAELFLGESSEETEPLKRVPCPELTYTQIKAVTAVSGVAGIKEYYGLLPETGDPCLEMVGQAVRYPDQSLAGCLEQIAAKYGDMQEEMLGFWKFTSEAYMVYPWDVSWYARETGRSSIDHGWHAAFLRGQQCSTPSWDSTRHAVFMKTDNAQPHPWMLEDIELRCRMAAGRLEQAVNAGTKMIPGLDKGAAEQMQESIESLDALMRICTAYALHLRETNVSMLLREDKNNERDLDAHLLDELHCLLIADAENQGGKGRVVQILEEYEQDREAWLDKYLIPVSEDIRERGHFSLTTR